MDIKKIVLCTLIVLLCLFLYSRGSNPVFAGMALIAIVFRKELGSIFKNDLDQ
ncbi:MAG: hypothetical protein RSC33_00600 [Vagococcus sp.]